MNLQLKEVITLQSVLSKLKDGKPSIKVAYKMSKLMRDIDNKTEAVVQKAIENLMRDKTVFVVAHRLSTIQNADKIVVINNGEIVEIGTHDELIKNECGAYKMLYDMQFKTKEPIK